MIAPETTDNSSTAVVNGSPVAVTPGLTVANAVVDLTGREITPEGTAADGHPLGIAVAVDDAVIGELWQIGTVRLRVTEPRIPCGTFAGVMEEQGWIKRFTQRARSGAYLAVDAPGEVRRGDEVRVISRPEHGITVAEAFRARTLERDLAPRVLQAGEDLSPKLLDRLQALIGGADPNLPS